MPRCGNCGQSRRRPAPQPQERVSPIMPSEGNVGMFNFEDDMILVDYISTQRGDHPLIGHARFSTKLQGLRMVNMNGMWQVNYGYRKGGDRFLVHRAELTFAPHLFRAVSTSIPEITIASQVATKKSRATPNPVKVRQILERELEQEAIPELPSQKRVDEEFDLQSLPGISSDIASQLKGMGVDTPMDILELGVEGLKELKGVGPQRAAIIFAALQKRTAEQ